MSAVSMIGLGSMGSALAGALLRGGNVTTVWNRTPTRADPLVAAGALQASTLAEVIGASPTAIICIDDHRSAYDLLSPMEVSHRMRGRTLFNSAQEHPRKHEKPRYGCESMEPITSMVR